MRAGNSGERVHRHRRPVINARPDALLAGPGRPGREGEVDGQRHRDVGLGDEHGARLGDHRPGALRGWQEAVLGPLGLGRIEAPGDPDGAVGQDPPLDLRRGLLRPDQDDAERPAALCDVEQDLLDRAVALARRVFVELIEDDEHQRPRGALAFLAGELAAQRDADDEPLRPVGQVVQVDDGDLGT